QGPDKPRPFHEQAGAEFVTVVDQENSLARIFGYRAVPNGILVDEEGKLQFQQYDGFDIKNDETRGLVSAFISDGEMSAQSADVTPGPVSDHFERGLSHYHEGEIERARQVWREGIAFDPENWNMRKQLWAVENPDRFYDGKVDYAWQREQVEQGR
ncbi:MAG: tetratricopeptide repeat protein, partial [Dehalococcoidia bacterium]|nr:tetratricopeptide repeat protein [Dehalococcoidia bacterium]